MNFLLFFVSAIFSLIFYIFYLASVGWTFFWYIFESRLSLDLFSWNLLIETTVFLLIAIFLFLWFTSFEKKEKKESKLDLSILSKWIEKFFKQYLYYIWFLLFYLSIYFILKSYNFDNFSVFILFVNIIIFVLFFSSKKFFVFRDFIKSNTILFSLYYIFFYLYSIFSNQKNFAFLDFINWFLIFSFFLLNFYNDRKILQADKSDKSLVFYFFIYNFLFLSYYFINIFWNSLFWVVVVWAFLSLFIYFYIVKLPFFKNNIVLLRSVSFIFLYISTIFWVIYTIKNGVDLFVIMILLYSIIFNFKVHYRFENYISLLISLLSFVFLIYYFYFNYLSDFDDGFLFLVISLWISIEMVVLTYFYRFKYFFDNHFIHSVAYLINIISLIYYFVKFEFDFFIMWIILLFESIFVFLSFYKLRQTNRYLNTKL